MNNYYCEPCFPLEKLENKIKLSDLKKFIFFY